MKLRKLQPKDADRMLSWMKDPDINKFFLMDKNNINKKSVLLFIEGSQIVKENLHLAITDEEDNYVGTVSLKDIDLENKKAEYAIATCKEIHGTGLAEDATNEILRIAFEELLLNKVYLNVLSENKRAIRFYEKNKFVFEGEFIEHYMIDNYYKNLKWYRILTQEYQLNKLQEL